MLRRKGCFFDSIVCIDDIHFRRCIIAAFARPAFSMVCSESVSSLLGNVVNNANVCVAYCGRALQRCE